MSSFMFNTEYKGVMYSIHQGVPTERFEEMLEILFLAVDYGENHPRVQEALRETTNTRAEILFRKILKQIVDVAKRKEWEKDELKKDLIETRKRLKEYEDLTIKDRETIEKQQELLLKSARQIEDLQVGLSTANQGLAQFNNMVQILAQTFPQGITK